MALKPLNHAATLKSMGYIEGVGRIHEGVGRALTY